MAGWWNNLIIDDMKGLKLLITAAAMILMAAGCAEEMIEPQVHVDSSVTFTAQIGEPSTKTVLDYDKKLSLWAGDEYISVLNGQDNYAFWSCSPEPAAVAAFYLIDEKPYVPSDVVAMYPARAEYTLNKQTMTVSGVQIPSNQLPSAGTYDVYGAVMMAYTKGSDLNFKNATSLIRFKVKDAGVWNVTLMSNDAQPMTGYYDLKWNNGSPEFEPMKVEDTPSVVNFVSVSAGGAFQVGEYYYACVAPGTYSKGFTITVNNVECRVTSESRTLVRNNIYDLGEIALPAAQSWGIAGTMNNWGENFSDFPLAEEDQWLVHKGLVMGFMDAFQFRADCSWGRQYGFAEPVKAGVVNTIVPDQRHDIFVYEPGIYDVYLAKDFTGFKMEKVGDIDGKPEAKNWGVVGTMNGWGSTADYAMTLEGNLYIARNVTILKTDEFKFRVDNAWEYDLGGELAPTDEYYYPVINNHPYAAKAQGSNITVEQDGVYDVYLSRYEDGFRIIKTADADEEEPTPEPDPEPELTESIWGIVGVINNWNAPDIKMLQYSEGLFVAYDVEMPEGGFKIRANGSWADEGNFGLSKKDNVKVDHCYSLVSGRESADMLLAAGTYDIWFDYTDSKVYIMTPGKDISEAVSDEPVTPDPSAQPWHVVGSFNGWNPADAAYLMTKKGDWYVFAGLALSDASEVKFAAGGWDVNRGGTWTGKNQALTLHAGGKNIAVPAGTYDIYLSADAKTAYFCTPGTRP